MRESDNDDNIVGASSTMCVMCLQKNRRDEREREISLLSLLLFGDDGQVTAKSQRLSSHSMSHTINILKNRTKLSF